jgi:hypothetical protein
LRYQRASIQREFGPNPAQRCKRSTLRKNCLRNHAFYAILKKAGQAK